MILKLVLVLLLFGAAAPPLFAEDMSFNLYVASLESSAMCPESVASDVSSRIYRGVSSRMSGVRYGRVRVRRYNSGAYASFQGMNEGDLLVEGRVDAKQVISPGSGRPVLWYRIIAKMRKGTSSSYMHNFSSEWIDYIALDEVANSIVRQIVDTATTYARTYDEMPTKRKTAISFTGPLTEYPLILTGGYSIPFADFSKMVEGAGTVTLSGGIDSFMPPFFNAYNVVLRGTIGLDFCEPAKEQVQSLLLVRSSVGLGHIWRFGKYRLTPWCGPGLQLAVMSHDGEGEKENGEYNYEDELYLQPLCMLALESSYALTARVRLVVLPRYTIFIDSGSAGQHVAIECGVGYWF